jgi:hypothetical protein
LVKRYEIKGEWKTIRIIKLFTFAYPLCLDERKGIGKEKNTFFLCLFENK